MRLSIDQAELRLRALLDSLGVEYSASGRSSRYLHIEVGLVVVTIRISDHPAPQGRGGWFVDANGCECVHGAADLDFSPGGLRLNQARRAIVKALAEARRRDSREQAEFIRFASPEAIAERARREARRRAAQAATPEHSQSRPKPLPLAESLRRGIARLEAQRPTRRRLRILPELRHQLAKQGG